MNQAIDDDYVNCPVPKTAGLGSASNCDFVRATVKHAQISSAISKQLLSAKARLEPAEATVANVRALDGRLNDWHKSLPPRFNTQAPFRNSAQPSGTQLYHDLFLHFSYQSSIIGIHGVFCYPWNKPELQSCKSLQVASQIEKSTEAVAEASRQIIIAVQGLQITSAMPLWYASHPPLAAAASPRTQRTPELRQNSLQSLNQVLTVFIMAKVDLLLPARWPDQPIRLCPQESVSLLHSKRFVAHGCGGRPFWLSSIHILLRACLPLSP